MQFVALDGFSSPPFSLPCGVPQGIALRPTFFNRYATPLIELFGFELVTCRDYTKIAMSATQRGLLPDSMTVFYIQGHGWARTVQSWIHPKLRSYCSEGTGPSDLRVGGLRSLAPSLLQALKPWNTFDHKVSFKGHINHITPASFFTLKLLQKVFPFIPSDLEKTVVPALFLSNLDYGNPLFMNIQKWFLKQLQTLETAAPWLLLDIPKKTSVSQSLAQLHWLPTRKHIDYKVLCIAFKSLHNIGLEYL